MLISAYFRNQGAEPIGNTESSSTQKHHGAPVARKSSASWLRAWARNASSNRVPARNFARSQTPKMDQRVRGLVVL